MNRKFDISVVIGRFSPPHSAHIALMNKALDMAENLVVIIGSYKSPRSIKNPWTAQERARMILEAFPLNKQKRIKFGFVSDTLYSEVEWVSTVSATVRSIAYELGYGNDYSPKIALVTHKKDNTTYYVDYFKSWKIIDVGGTSTGGVNNSPLVSASKVRELYFEGYFNLLNSICPPNVVKYLHDFAKTKEYEYVYKEYHDALKYDLQFENVPYGQINFVTVDSLVVQSGHVLLIQRKNSPGVDLWALPGGHLNINETFLTGALRELKEETGIKVPERVLRGSIFFDHVFDHPDRSLRCRTKVKRGRTITRLFCFKLDDSAELPHVKSGDDAKSAWWFTFDEVQNMQDQLFEDHYSMIMTALNKL